MSFHALADISGRSGLRVAVRGDLFVSRTRTSKLRRRSFSITAPVVWNSLPPHLHSPPKSRNQFRAGLNSSPQGSLHWQPLGTLFKSELNWTELTKSSAMLPNIQSTLHKTFSCICVGPCSFNFMCPLNNESYESFQDQAFELSRSTPKLGKQGLETSRLSRPKTCPITQQAMSCLLYTSDAADE